MLWIWSGLLQSTIGLKRVFLVLFCEAVPKKNLSHQRFVVVFFMIWWGSSIIYHQKNPFGLLLPHSFLKHISYFMGLEATKKYFFNTRKSWYAIIKGYIHVFFIMPEILKGFPSPKNKAYLHQCSINLTYISWYNFLLFFVWLKNMA